MDRRTSPAALALTCALTTLSGDARATATVADALGLECFCWVERIDMYRDGGSWGGILRDREGRSLEFSWDGAARIIVPGQPPPSEPRLAYVGARHPSIPGARPLPVGSVEEAWLVEALQAWVDRKVAPDVQEEWSALYWDTTKPTAERRASLPVWRDEWDTVFPVLKIVNALRTQREAARADG